MTVLGPIKIGHEKHTHRLPNDRWGGQGRGEKGGGAEEGEGEGTGRGREEGETV